MPKISKIRIKQLALLKQKKTRDEQNLFVAEGEKIITELLNSKTEIVTIVAVKEWIEINQNNCNNSIELLEATKEDLKRVSLMTTPNKVAAYVKTPVTLLDINILDKKLTLVLDEIQDPGNLGTIIRLAEWFGIENIICSNNSVDLYNPKVIQATMGAFLKVNVYYVDLERFFREINNKKNKLAIFGTFMEGKSIYSVSLPPEGLIVLGNESKGISETLRAFIDEKITIPSFNNNSKNIDSLNVSVAAAIICSEFRRRNFN
jgi:TrmH family RNA methyltransferase